MHVGFLPLLLGRRGLGRGGRGPPKNAPPPQSGTHLSVATGPRAVPGSQRPLTPEAVQGYFRAACAVERAASRGRLAVRSFRPPGAMVAMSRRSPSQQHANSLLPVPISAFVSPVKLNLKRLELPMAHTWTIARGAGTNISKVIVVELIGADGTIGYGEASPISRYKESVDTVEAFCQQVDARGLSFTDIEGSMTYLDTLSRHDMAAKCALNIALLDGAGKRAKKPIYDLLELGFRNDHHVTSFTIGIDKPEIIRKKVLEAERYPVLKVKLGIADDKVNLQALREVAPEKRSGLTRTKAGKRKSRPSR